MLKLARLTRCLLHATTAAMIVRQIITSVNPTSWLGCTVAPPLGITLTILHPCQHLVAPGQPLAATIAPTEDCKMPWTVAGRGSAQVCLYWLLKKLLE